MTKRILALVLALTLVFALASCKPSTGNTGDDKPHIGIVTGTTNQSEDEYRSAEAFVKKYGDVKDGGQVSHVTYPDNFDKEQETTISQITQLADDPNMKAIIVCQAVPGTAAAFQKIRETRTDIKLIAGETQEDFNVITEQADFVVCADNVSRGYLMLKAAQKMGAKKFAHISFPRHMGIENLSRRFNIMKVAAKDLGMEFIELTAPDPLSDVGMPGAQQTLLESMPTWVAKYGKDTAFFTTNDGLTEPLLKQVAALGAIFVEADLPSPIIGYPGAFNIDLKAEAGDWPAILEKVEKAVVAKGGAKRMGTWAYSYTFTAVQALAELGLKIANGEAQLTQEDIMACYEAYTPGAKWNGCLYPDADGKINEKLMIVYQDTYVFGQGYLKMTEEKIPEKYKKN